MSGSNGVLCDYLYIMIYYRPRQKLYVPWASIASGRKVGFNFIILSLLLLVKQLKCRDLGHLRFGVIKILLVHVHAYK